jgi:Golgi SNAP receptor complex protein 2
MHPKYVSLSEFYVTYALTAPTRQKAANDRQSLLGPSSSSSYSSSTAHVRNVVNRTPAESPFGHNYPPSSVYTPRTDAALNENSFINNTGNALDQYIAQGQAILGNLNTQKDVMKSKCERLLLFALGRKMLIPDFYD